MLGEIFMAPVAFAALTLVPGLLLVIALIEAAFPGRLPQAFNNILSNILDSIFFDSDQHFKAINNNSGYLLGQLLGKCVGLISPPEWQAVRAVMQGPFLQRSCQNKAGQIHDMVDSFLATLYQSRSFSAGALHPTRDLKMLPFWIVCDLFYGQLPAQFTEQLKGLVIIREDLMKHAMSGGIVQFNLSRMLPTQANRDLRIFKSQWQRFNSEVVAYLQHRKCAAPIVDMYDAIDTGKVSEEHVLQTLDEAIFANLDVTTGGLSWNPVFLAAYPECQEKLRQEINQVQKDGRMDQYLRSTSTYLQACILESSRLKPLAAFSVPQSAPTDRVVFGYKIPAKTNFIVDTYALNIRSDHWGPDNDTYRPERFLARDNVKLRYLFWRFGFGPRQCMGKYATDIIIRATLVNLVQNYNLQLPDKTNWSRDKSCWITHPDFEICCERIQSETPGAVSL
ncbi:Cytochrome P450 monooxygenase roqR [Penicillium rolfsii]|nr:Cytochrome P450 monooxygenase roqR [Penicillium rolfsii]